MAITPNEVDHIAQLACLDLSPEQARTLQADMTSILALVQQLQSVDTTGVAPMEHPLSGRQDLALRLRDDVARPTASASQRDALMANAPASADGLFLVPTVIE